MVSSPLRVTYRGFGKPALRKARRINWISLASSSARRIAWVAITPRSYCYFTGSQPANPPEKPLGVYLRLRTQLCARRGGFARRRAKAEAQHCLRGARNHPDRKLVGGANQGLHQT